MHEPTQPQPPPERGSTAAGVQPPAPPATAPAGTPAQPPSPGPEATQAHPARPAGPGAVSRLAHGVGRGAAATARVSRHGAVAGARLTTHGAAGAVRVARRASRSGGAGETGLHRLIEIHFFSIMGDTLVALALAGTVFFAMPTGGGGSREQIAMFLLLTMLPFIFLAPLIGPFLDRHRRGRRWVIGAMMGVRAVLCVVLANSLGGLTVTQFVATLGVLVASKAYNVSRIAAAPRLLPEAMTLVKANGRMSMAGVIGATLAAPVGVGIGMLGPEWILYLACVVFGTALVLSIMLSGEVDAVAESEDGDAAPVPLRSGKVTVPPPVVRGFRVNAGLRALSGFLMIFMAFDILQHPFPGWEDDPTLLLGIVVGAVGVGNAIGTAVAALVKSHAPQVVLVLVLVADAVMAVVAAVSYSVWTTLGIALVAGLCQQLGKLALDALIQKTVPEEVHTTIFGRSETVLQLAFVLGAFVGLIPMPGEVGMVVAAVLLVLWTLIVLVLRSGTSLPSFRPSFGKSKKKKSAPTPPPAPAPAAKPAAPAAPEEPAHPPTAPMPHRTAWGVPVRNQAWDEPDPDDERF